MGSANGRNIQDSMDEGSNHQEIDGSPDGPDSCGEDRISRLPDSVLAHVLSFLPIDEAIQTGVLSKAFALKWNSSPNLIFHQHGGKTDNGRKKIKDFIDFVDKTIHLYDKTCKVHKFTIRMDYRDETEGIRVYDFIERWLSFATWKGVEELHLGLNDEYVEEASEYEDVAADNVGGWINFDTYILPQFIFTHSSMKKLSTRYCELVPDGTVSWTRLKTLSIECAFLSEDIIRNILMGSPVLESLELHYCEGLTLIDICSVSVKKLIITGIWESETYTETLKISGPNLRSLVIGGKRCTREIELLDISSVVDAKLEIDMLPGDDFDFEACSDMTKPILEKLSQVEELTVGRWWIPIISAFELKNEGDPSPITKHRCLKLDTVRDIDWHLPGIARLLKSSPDLEKLLIKMDPSGWIEEPMIDPVVHDDTVMASYWASQEKSFEGLLQHLKIIEIEIVGFSSYDGIIEKDFVERGIIFIGFLLKNAKGLEKLIIDAPAVEVKENLRCLPRASPMAEVLFTSK